MSEDPTLLSQRRGFWMRMARERAGLTQESAAKLLGLSGRSKSTLSSWEVGRREPKGSVVAAMALLYGVTTDLLLQPYRTAYEVMDARLDQLRRGVGEQERQDWDAGREPDPGDGAGPDAGPGRRPA